MTSPRESGRSGSRERRPPWTTDDHDHVSRSQSHQAQSTGSSPRPKPVPIPTQPPLLAPLVHVQHPVMSATGHDAAPPFPPPSSPVTAPTSPLSIPIIAAFDYSGALMPSSVGSSQASVSPTSSSIGGVSLIQSRPGTSRSGIVAHTDLTSLSHDAPIRNRGMIRSSSSEHGMKRQACSLIPIVNPAASSALSPIKVMPTRSNSFHAPASPTVSVLAQHGRGNAGSGPHLHTPTALANIPTKTSAPSAIHVTGHESPSTSRPGTLTKDHAVPESSSHGPATTTGTGTRRPSPLAKTILLDPDQPSESSLPYMHAGATGRFADSTLSSNALAVVNGSTGSAFSALSSHSIGGSNSHVEGASTRHLHEHFASPNSKHETKLAASASSTDESGSSTTSRGSSLPTVIERIQAAYLHQLQHPHTLFWRVWSRLIIAIEAYNLFASPFAVAWICHFTITPMYMYFGYLLDVFLMLDVWLNLHRHYEDEFGVIVTDPSAIKQHYLRHSYGVWNILGSLPVDLIAIISPLLDEQKLLCERTFFSETESYGFVYAMGPIPDHLYAWSGLRLMRWFRMPHLLGVFFNWEIPGIRNVAISRLVKNLIAFLTAGHIDACLFFLLNVWEDIGTAWIDTIGIRNFEREVLFLTQYNTSFLAALQSIVYVFREIKTNAERLYTMGEIIIGSIIYGCIFGVLSNFIRAMDTKAALDKKAEKHRFKMDLLRTFLRSKKFPVDLQQKILEHEEFLWIKGQGMDEDELFANLPVSLRQDACNHLFMDMINRVPLFRATDLNFRFGLTRAVKSMVVPENFYVCRAGETSYEMYFVRAGELDVILPAAAGGGLGGMNTLGVARTMAKPIRIGPGAYFGELSLIDNSRVPVTVRTRTTAELCVLTRESFSELVAAYPPVAESLRQALAQRRAAEARAAAEAAQKARASSQQLQNAQKNHGPAALRIMTETASRLAERFGSMKRNESAGVGGGIRGRLGTLGRGSRAAAGEDGDGGKYSAVGKPLMSGAGGGAKPVTVATRMLEGHGLANVDSESRIGMADRLED